jgi:catechol 2,3-dioxygenase-like lactoylglutathione lyase family enzyme
MSDIDIFHHIGLITRDMARLIARYEQLGFMFTPLSMPRIVLTPGGAPEPLGAGNRHAIFADNYLEVLGVVDAARWASITKAQRGAFDIDPPLARYEGLHVMHFGTDDIEAVERRYRADGVASGEIVAFQRNVETPNGPQMMRARCLSLMQHDLPSLSQIAQTLTPELVLQPRYQQHRNGARSIREVILCDAAPEQIAATYARIAGHPVERRGDDFVIDLGHGQLTVVAPDRLGALIPGATPPTLPYLAGFAVTVDDLAQPRAVLRDAGVPFVEHGGRVIVATKDACGCAVLFAAD